MNHSRPRIAVVGGGPAGLATALALRTYRFEVILIEKGHFDEVRIGEHLSPNALPWIQKLGIPEALYATGHRLCLGVRSFWGTSQADETDYLFNPYGQGWNLNRPSFDRALADLARERGVSLLEGTRFRKIFGEPSNWQLHVETLAGRQTIKAEFVVDAGARNSLLARMLGQSNIGYDKLVGIVGFLKPRNDLVSSLRTHLLVESMPRGWWYLSGLEDGQAVAAWMSDSDLNAERQVRPLELWQREQDKSKEVKKILQAFHPPSEVHIRLASSTRIRQAANLGWLSVGDAAMGFDPLSSSGILKGLRGGIQTAETIERHFCGEPDALLAYDRSIQQEFRDYLQTRASYYRMETRWPTGEFWQRRQAPLPWEMPLTLDPLVSLKTGHQEISPEAQDFLNCSFPGLNCALLKKLAQSPSPAHRIVSCYHGRTDQKIADREVINALQILVEWGVLQKEASLCESLTSK